jgi:hypothetical protein
MVCDFMVHAFWLTMTVGKTIRAEGQFSPESWRCHAAAGAVDGTEGPDSGASAVLAAVWFCLPMVGECALRSKPPEWGKKKGIPPSSGGIPASPRQI